MGDIWYVSRLSLLLPAAVVALAVAAGTSGRVARWLGLSWLLAFVMILNAGLVVAGTLTPLRADYRPEPGSRPSCDLSRLRPATPAELLRPSDVLGNVLLFVPLGATIALAPRSRRKAAVLAGAAAFPLAIEAAQLLLPSLGRACQSADVADNLSGLVVGLGAGGLAALVAGRRADRGATPG